MRVVPGDLIAFGREADVFALGEQRVLRRYRAGGDVAEEAAVMRYLAGYGFPVPAVYEARGADLVLERLDGPTMLAALLGGQVTPAGAARTLADLLGHLHALPPRSGSDTDRILHLDLHPDNVLLTERGPVVIDWRNVTEGPAGLDVATTCLIMAEAAAGSHLPPEHVPAARAVLSAFLVHAPCDPTSHLEQALTRRRANPTLTAEEIDRLDLAAALVRGHP